MRRSVECRGVRLGAVEWSAGVCILLPTCALVQHERFAYIII